MAMQQFDARGIYSVADQHVSQSYGHSVLFAGLPSNSTRIKTVRFVRTASQKQRPRDNFLLSFLVRQLLNVC